ncbi:hypothetical protein MuYL_3068 [Mucilaginibacter xinganensis]|uniref:Uncharacterized protein n=1 Tax=Mucilaginibacter xinganensis TaxID=1234841 RepID=A0A223NYL8_9SPHI|nr:hypothetical protein MuYL_3068 [Mucilaginibacter xinganensis]
MCNYSVSQIFLKIFFAWQEGGRMRINLGGYYLVILSA